MTNETNISFYLKPNRIHVFIDALRGIGSPKFICFLIEENGETLIMAPYGKKDFHSHRVPNEVYHGYRSMELCSLPLCSIVAKLYGWEPDCSYRVPGTILRDKHMVIFYLKQATLIEHEEYI